jgi:hypothetical protein
MSQARLLHSVSANVSQFGRHVVTVDEGSHAPAYAYTIGLHHTHGHPEILTLGLAREDSESLLSTLAAEVASGRRFGEGEIYRNTPADMGCGFRPVAREAYPSFLGLARKFYNSLDFPVLQCVWPDPQGRYPWQSGFSPILQWRQPLLQDPATATAVAEWGFLEPYNLGVSTTSHVLGGDPVLMVTHDRHDAGWHFLSGTTEAPDQGRRVALIELVRRDPTLNRIGNLPLGGMAIRDSRRDPWQRIE